MKLYTYFKAMEIVEERLIYLSETARWGTDEWIKNKNQYQRLRDGLIRRFERIEFKNAMLKIELEDYKERYQALEWNEGITFERYES